MTIIIQIKGILSKMCLLWQKPAMGASPAPFF